MNQQQFTMGEFNFPPTQYLIPSTPVPPAPYMPPGPYTGPYMAPDPHTLHLSLCPPTQDTNNDGSQPDSRRKRAGSESAVTPPPAKRKPGRPRGSKSKKATAEHPPPAPPTKAAQKAAPKKVALKKANQENIPPVIYIDIDSSDDESGPGQARWAAEEKTRVFSFILGPTDDGDRRFKQHKTDPGHVYKRASELEFGGKRSADSIKSMFGRALKTYGWIRAFEGFTGNGGGDADSDDAAAVLKNRLSGARHAGLPIGALKPNLIDEWEKNGWTELFNSRFGTSAKVARQTVRNSSTAVSDIEDESGHSSDTNVDPQLRSLPAAKTPAAPAASAATVSEPKHTPSSAFRKQVSNSFGNIGDIVKLKMLAEDKKASVLDARLTLEREKFEMDKTKGKVDMAHKILSTAGASDQVKDAANAWLLTLFS